MSEVQREHIERLALGILEYVAHQMQEERAKNERASLLKSTFFAGKGDKEAG